jgi:hypothetical protein
MEEREWNDRIVGPLQEAINAGVFDEGTATTLGYLVNLGNSQSDDETQLDAIARSIKELCKGKAGSPFGRRGKKPTLPSGALAVSDSLCAEIATTAEEWYNSNGAYAAVILRHGRSAGNPQFVDGAEYGASVSKKCSGVLKSLYKAETWDGTLEGLLSIDMTEEE